MAGRIPQSFIDELLARTDIVEVVGSRVQLKKGGREWKAPCPFHNEKTPSFWVSPDKQFYHCFGCGAHGTALGFLMEHDKLPFPDAVEELASRLGLEVPREDDGRGPRERPGEDLYSLLSQVTQFYRDALKDSKAARDYLKRRGLNSETCVQFAIGYAPDAWDSVLKRFGGAEERVRRLLDTGLIIERSGSREAGHYDRFRDRLMFPIRDIRGRTVGFGGRIIGEGEPKYLNSPETPLFHKGRELYGLYEARQALRQVDRLLLVEGYMDVVRLAQAGIHYAVATLGTATTPEHLNRLFRVTNEVVFCFDGDRAGRSAAWRALENALGHARCSCPKARIPTRWSARKARKPSKPGWRRRCRCPSSWSASSPRRSTSAPSTAERGSLSWPGRWSSACRRASTANCCSSGSPRKSACRPAGCSPCSGWTAARPPPAASSPRRARGGVPAPAASPC